MRGQKLLKMDGECLFPFFVRQGECSISSLSSHILARRLVIFPIYYFVSEVSLFRMPVK